MRNCTRDGPSDIRHVGGAKGEAATGSNREGESTDTERRDGAARSGMEGLVMGPERRGCVVQPWPLANWKREELDKAKPFKIPKREVWEAFKGVKANQGAAGKGHGRAAQARQRIVLRLSGCNGPYRTHPCPRVQQQSRLLAQRAAAKRYPGGDALAARSLPRDSPMMPQPAMRSDW